MKAIASARTPGPWTAEARMVSGHVPRGRPNGEIIVECHIRVMAGSRELDSDNARFIAMAANHFDRLLAVADAAKLWAIECREDIGHDKMNLTFLCQALKALEGVE